MDDSLIEKVVTVFEYELDIDLEEDLYLFTWSPDPKRLPNASFLLQHDYAISIISDFLFSCKCGLACVETTQLGNPHYHGWYQLSTDSLFEQTRIAMVKTMQQIGLIKITKSIGHYRINGWSQHANCLFYYKKDLIQSMLHIKRNPITSGMKSIENWCSAETSHYFAVDGKRQTVADIEERQNIYQFYMQFYSEQPVEDKGSVPSPSKDKISSYSIDAQQEENSSEDPCTTPEWYSEEDCPSGSD